MGPDTVLGKQWSRPLQRGTKSLCLWNPFTSILANRLYRLKRRKSIVWKIKLIKYGAVAFSKVHDAGDDVVHGEIEGPVPPIWTNWSLLTPVNDFDLPSCSTAIPWESPSMFSGWLVSSLVSVHKTQMYQRLLNGCYEICLWNPVWARNLAFLTPPWRDRSHLRQPELIL